MQAADIAWQFAPNFDPQRRRALEQIATFAAVVEIILAEAVVTTFRVCRGKVGLLRQCCRPEFELALSPEAADLFFNSPAGYRAQYLADPDEGQKQNARLIAALINRLISHAEAHPAKINMPVGRIRLALSACSAKVWLPEASFAFNHDLIEEIVVPLWHRNALAIEYRWAEGRLDRVPELASELVRLKVDLIFAPGTAVAQAAKKSTPTIPIVFATAGNPVGDGLIASFARSGGNATGLSLLAGPEIGGKYLELLKEAVPGVSRVAVLWNPLTACHTVVLKETGAAARTLGLELQPVRARRPDEIDGAFAAMSRARADGLIVLADPMFVSLRARITDLATKGRLPAMYGLGEHTEAGGLLSYAASLPDLFRRAATYVDKILKGAKPADLPVEQPTRYDFVINLKTAKALGLTIPPPLLLRADRVID